MSRTSSTSTEGQTVPPETGALTCYHCGDRCPDALIFIEDKHFCCEGCKLVYEILQQNDLCTYYDIEQHPGIQLKGRKDAEAFAYLDNPDIQQKLLDFADGDVVRVTFFVPKIHCASCIWLLENLYKLREGVLQSRVDFLRKEVYLTFKPDAVSLRELVNLLSTIGYEPEIHLDDLGKKSPKRNNKAFYFRLGVAGFCFGNIMLLSFPEYLGLRPDETIFRQFFGYLNILLALPVAFYSASVFFVSAWQGLRQRYLNIDVPVSLGIIVLFSRSLFEILAHTGSGYMDSLAGLVFFLLAGRWFQNKTYDRLSFERDYTAYFPVSTTRKAAGQEESVAITDLSPGDTIVVRNQELVPADALLLSEEAQIDYSFVTGESEPVRKVAGDLIYAGGRQVGQAIELTLVKEVSQSYLTQLWNHTVFDKDQQQGMHRFIDRIGRRFTFAILTVGFLAGLYWWWADSPGMAANVFTAVLIVACPCALALTEPITLGNAMRILGRAHLYLKHTGVIERMSRITHAVFDKTGTLTHKNPDSKLRVEGQLDPRTRDLIATLARQSSHPVSRAVEAALAASDHLSVSDFQEVPGAGLSGMVDGHALRLGRWDFVHEETSEQPDQKGTWASVDGKTVARFVLDTEYREGLQPLLKSLSRRMKLSLVSGDNDREREALAAFFPAGSPMRFQQAPADKLAYVASLQATGEKVLMAGDGLNDAGALQGADVGIALSENVDTFSPACDAILDAQAFSRLDQFLTYARTSMNLVRAGLFISLAYNLVGLSIAIQGLLSPVIAAILMPLSSVTIVMFGVLATEWTALRQGLRSQPDSKT
ncbi:MAG: HAD family hydrolase [Bacteroidetes bacterium]|nr:MAG: HAD family hydrolase [Bacteroidota bacterium]